MSFFDDKQEVLKIELTPYGKNLLANGKLKPVFYSFHDDEILYDIQFSNGSELQHSASSRILDETIYLKPQGRIAPVDYTTRNIKPQDETTDNNLFLTILGNSSLNSDYKPAWNLKLLRGSISGTSNYYTGSTVQFLPIPQINLRDVYFTLSTKAASEEKNSLDFKFLDNTALSLDRQFLLMDISEINVDPSENSKNFEIEIFQVQTSGSREYLDKINFPPEAISIINNILLDKPEILISEDERQRRNLILTDNYFNMAIDEEIDIDTLLGPQTETTLPEAETKTKPPFGEDC